MLEDNKISAQGTQHLGQRVANVSYVLASAVVPGTNAATASNYQRFFCPPYPFEVIEAWATWEAAGGANASVGLVRMKKNQDALSAGQNVLSASFDVTGTANQVHRIRGQNVLSARFIDNGDTLGLYASGTLTGANNFIVTTTLRPMTTVLSQKDTP